MLFVRKLASRGALIPWAVLVLIGPALAQSSPSDQSTPAERAKTQQLNNDISNANAAAAAQSDAQGDESNAQYQAQQQQYQSQQQDYQNQKQQYEATRQNYADQAARYEAARDRYAAERARYHREVWPSRYEHRLIVGETGLMDARVESEGQLVGRVEEIARTPEGHVDALRVSLNNGEGDVWIDSNDLRFDPDDRVAATDLTPADLDAMARERF